MASGLVSGSSGPCPSPSQRHCVAFLGKHFTLTVPLSTQVYKWVPANLILGGGGYKPCNGLASHPGGRRNTCSRFMLQKLG